MKHPYTPGPWHVETRESDIMRDGKPVPYYAVAHTSPARDCFVALDVAPVEIFFGATGATALNSEGKANADLIAAAPDLLAALGEAAKQFDYIVRALHLGQTVSISSVQNCAANARAAINKAVKI